MEHPEDSSDEDRADPSMEHPEDSEDSEDEERSGPTEGHEILDLMMPMFSGMKDEFGKELVPPLRSLFCSTACPRGESQCQELSY